MAFDAPARQSVVAELVGKAHLPNAIALNSVAFNSSRVIGPAIAAIFVSTIGLSGCFYINGVSFLAVILALLSINIKQKISISNNSPLKDLLEGLKFVMENRLILSLISMVAVVSLFGVAHIILMPVFANDVLKVGIKGLGFLMSSAGIGALIGALILARLGNFKYKGKLLSISILIFAVALIFFALSKSYPFSLIALFFIGASSVQAVALVNTILQTSIEDRFRGRVMSVFMITFAGMMPFGNFFAGLLASKFGVSFAVMTGGIVCALYFIIINVFYPKIRQI
jgi:predicted MFS family arabinose efflux permease